MTIATRPIGLAVNDVYASIQGEGCQTGVPMVLVRLQGCDVGCPFCDTKETWSKHDEFRADTLEDAMGQNHRWAVVRPTALATMIERDWPGVRWVLVTGGEPADQELQPFVDAVHGTGREVAIETSGTADGVLGVDFDWITVSPKIGMPGGRSVLLDVVRFADEVKHVIGKREHLDQLDRLLEAAFPGSPHPLRRESPTICLQPMSQNPKATRLCIDTCLERGWRLSVQVHKYLEVP